MNKNLVFFGTMATRLRVLSADDWCKTAATDGRHVFYNTAFFHKMTIPQIKFVLAHEVLHNAFDHMRRREHRNPLIHNYATDYCVNGSLIRDSIGTPPDIPYLHDTKYEGMPSEEIYELLLKDMNDGGLGEFGQLIDEHYDWGEPDPNNPNRPVYSEKELEAIREEVRNATIRAAQQAGTLPAGIDRLINDWVHPQMNWRELIRQSITSLIKNDYTFMRPNRKSQHLNAVLPGQQFDTKIDICVAVDMSGSITNEQASVFLSEVKGIMEEFNCFDVKVMCFD
jgi:predicted metal-dependent peptidase